MIVIIGIIAAFVLLVIVGNAMGPPDPSKMSIDAILDRMRTEEAWIHKYNLLPYENQQGAGIKKQYEDKKLYCMQLSLELMKRGTDPDQETLIPALQRSIELIKGGMNEKDAHAQAVNEYVQQRDANASNSSEETL
jgi:hypothetical protein